MEETDQLPNEALEAGDADAEFRADETADDVGDGFLGHLIKKA